MCAPPMHSAMFFFFTFLTPNNPFSEKLEKSPLYAAFSHRPCLFPGAVKCACLIWTWSTAVSCIC